MWCLSSNVGALCCTDLGLKEKEFTHNPHSTLGAPQVHVVLVTRLEGKPHGYLLLGIRTAPSPSCKSLRATTLINSAPPQHEARMRGETQVEIFDHKLGFAVPESGVTIYSGKPIT